MSPGDKVRFLNSTGGGTIKKIDGKIAIVEDEDGFESPFMVKDLVVVLPAGHVADLKGAKMMFDQKAFDEGKKSPEVTKPATIPSSLTPAHSAPAEETDYGDEPSVTLAFEPSDVKKLSSASFAAVLVNDSNYFLDFIFLGRRDGDKGWEVKYKGSLSPNELIDMAVVTHDNIGEFERVALQAVAYKEGKHFSLLPPLNVSRRLDLTKFHKFHCFRESKYFDSPVIEFPLLSRGETVAQIEMKPEVFQKPEIKTEKPAKPHKTSPHKLLPLIEVDLHMHELTDTTAGMQPADMLEMQLNEVRKTMQAHSRRIGQKIVFIHGKGEGVLRNAVLALLKKEYPKAMTQDASFREYGFGATLVTVK